MEEETPIPTKEDRYFELLQYCDINPDYINDEIRLTYSLLIPKSIYSS